MAVFADRSTWPSLQARGLAIALARERQPESSMKKVLFALAMWFLCKAGAFAQPVILDPNLEIGIAAGGLSLPTSMVFIGADDFLVLQKNDGKIMRVTGGVLDPAPVLDVDVDPRSFGGLLSIVLHPEFAANKYIYVFFTEGNTGNDAIGSAVANRVYRYTWDEALGALTTPLLIAEFPALPTGSGNYSGIMIFGPDRKLYITIGDLGRTGQLQNNSAGAAPDDTSVIVRLNDDGTTPQDNPFRAQGDVMAQYFAYGIRNSFGMAFDPVTGKLWNTENGPMNWDEINLVERGFNSGWNKIQGPISQDPDAETTADLHGLPRSRYADPKFSWFESIGVTGIVFLESAELGAIYENNVLVGDYVFGNLYRFEPNAKRDGFVLLDGLADKAANNSTERNDLRLGEGFGSISALALGPDGLVYVVSISDGNIYVIRPVVKVGAAVVPDGVAGAAYNSDLSVTGGSAPYGVSVTSGALPAGLGITGTSLAGTPVAAGNFSFTLQVSEAGGAISERSYSLRVHRQLSLRTKKLPRGRAGRPYRHRMKASGGKTNYTWAVTAGALPAGLSLDPGTGKITGTPAGAGIANLTLQVTDSLGVSAEQALSLMIR
jgi:glucose/arabinose dehydrogenase